MKGFILSIIVVLFISGCADKRLILIPSNSYYPTFPTTDFQKSEKYKINMWVETEEVNGTIKTYMVAEKNDMMGFIRDTKTLRSDYNTLLKEINKFNQRIRELNKIQNEKKPTEVESIDSAWYK